MHKRGFCPNCGSQLFAWFGHMPGVLGIKAGTLDDPSNYVPTMDFHVSSAAPWDFMNPELPSDSDDAQPFAPADRLQRASPAFAVG
ncbi:GFA family protein [Acidithiobacillus thiooxidans]